ncbi:MAG: hypothetical protein NVSMB52_11180 [Chloroflexota bacterium]
MQSNASIILKQTLSIKLELANWTYPPPFARASLLPLRDPVEAS